jgi:hypothetical protein
MATDTQTRTGRCAAHGVVAATRQLPQVRYPILIDLAVRAVARHRRYQCPVCGAAVKV